MSGGFSYNVGLLAVCSIRCPHVDNAMHFHHAYVEPKVDKVKPGGDAGMSVETLWHRIAVG
jgi:hypothetical protein